MTYDPYSDWPETVALIVLCAGFFLSVLARSMMFQYIIIILGGMVFGRLFARWKPHRRYGLVLIMIGFLMGSMLGGVWANKKLLVVFYAIGIWAGWNLEKEGLLRTVTFS